MLNLAISQNRNYLKCGEQDILYATLDISPDESTQIAPKNHHVALAIDCSGSMDGKKIEDAKTAAINLVNSLSPNDLISIITFDSNAQVILNPTPASSNEIEHAIRSINVGGATALHAAIVTGLKLLESVSVSGSRRLELISDGEPTVNPAEDKAFNDISSDLRRAGITLDVIGIGDDYKERLLKMLAETGGGKWEHVGDSGDLTKTVNMKMAEMQNTVIANPQLELEFAAGTELISIEITMPTIQEIGPESRRMEGNTVYIGLKDIIKDESQVVAMKISVPPINGKEVPFLTAAITEGGSELTHQTAVISCSDDPGLYNSESDPNPRAIFESSEATILLGKGLEGDSEATKLAETILQDLDNDESTKMLNPEAEATVMHAKQVSKDIKPGMSKLEVKRVLHEATTLAPSKRHDARNKTCPHCHSEVPQLSEYCGKCGKNINEEQKR